MSYRFADRTQRRTAAPITALCAVAGTFVVLGLGSGAAQAAEPITGLASAFRPQPAHAAPASEAQRDPNATGVSGLRTVVSGQGRPLALIDGRVVHEGDVVNGQRVRRITRDEVVLGNEDGAAGRVKVNASVTKTKRLAKQDSNGVDNP